MKALSWMPLVSLLGCASMPSCGHERVGESPERAPALVLRGQEDDLAELKPTLSSLLAELRRGGTTRVAYRPPEPSERDDFAMLVRQALAGQVKEAATTRFVQRVLGAGQLVVVSERQEQRAGAGAVVLRPRGTSRLIIEAPHTFFDGGTLDIACTLFFSLRARALVVNTVHRGRAASVDASDGSDEQAQSESSVSDVAHQPDALFTVAHRSLVESLAATTLQIHGFADQHLPQFDLVVSAARTHAKAQRVASALRDALPTLRVAVYPDDTRELGGTTNAQARVSRDLSAPFLHLELSSSLRKLLQTDAASMDRFAAALARAERASGLR